MSQAYEDYRSFTDYSVFKGILKSKGIVNTYGVGLLIGFMGSNSCFMGFLVQGYRQYIVGLFWFYGS